MRRLTLPEFLSEVADSEALRMKLARFASEHGFDVGELREDDLRALVQTASGEEGAQATPDTVPVRPEGWFRTRAAERRSGNERRIGVVPVSVDRRKQLRRGRLVRRHKTR